MKKYLSEIHTKSPTHKKRFALLVSGGVTFVIFSIWSVVKFGSEPVIVKETTGPVNLAAVSEAAPLENIFKGIKSSWDSLLIINQDGK